MTEPLGRIDKPEAEQFKEGRKLYLVPMVFYGEDAPRGYKERCQRYWKQAAEQLANLEAKIGKVSRIYLESISQSGEEGVELAARLNPECHQIARSKCDDGAAFEAMEDRELFEEAMDWERCLLLGFATMKVVSKVSEFYTEALRKRYDFMAKKITETLKDNEAGLLFITERHRLQFPEGIEVFTISPPALDEVHRWLRDEAGKKEEATREEK